jgi:hypothetical protein
MADNIHRGHPLIVAFRVALDRETHRLADESQTDA